MSDQTPISQDPEVLAEEKKNRIWHLKLERYKEMAGAVGVILQAFKSEAMSLISGVGTLVVGWFQIRKMVVKGRAEVRAEGRAQGTLEGRVAGRAAERADRKADRIEMAPHKAPVTAMPPPPPPGGELAPPPDTTVIGGTPFMLDPMNYITVGLPVIFVWSTVFTWMKRRRKQLEQKEESNG